MAKKWYVDPSHTKVTVAAGPAPTDILLVTQVATGRPSLQLWRRAGTVITAGEASFANGEQDPGALPSEHLPPPPAPPLVPGGTDASQADLTAERTRAQGVEAGKQDAATAATDVELAAEATRVNSGFIQVVQHGAVAATARPAGAARVYWLGTATPANALQYDRWVNPASTPYVESIYNGATWDVIGAATFVPIVSAPGSEVAASVLSTSYAVTNALANVPGWQVVVPANSGTVEVGVPEGLLCNIVTGTNPVGTKFTLELAILDELNAVVAYSQWAMYAVVATTQTWANQVPLMKSVPNNAAAKTYRVQAKMNMSGTLGSSSNIYTVSSGFPSLTLRAVRR